MRTIFHHLDGRYPTFVVGAFSNHDLEIRAGNITSAIFRYIAGATRWITFSGSNGGDPKLSTSAGALKIGVAARGTVITLTDAATVTPDFNAGNYFAWAHGGGARLLGNPSNLAAGQGGVITIRQPGTGNGTLAVGSYWKPIDKTPQPLSTAANAVDDLFYHVVSSTEIHYSIGRNFG